jgi:hypothetical protein
MLSFTIFTVILGVVLQCVTSPPPLSSLVISIIMKQSILLKKVSKFLAKSFMILTLGRSINFEPIKRHHFPEKFFYSCTIKLLLAVTSSVL